MVRPPDSTSIVRLAVLALVALVPDAALAQPAAPPRDDVPPVLEPWIPWALSGEPPLACPARLGATDADRVGGRLCAWPGELRIEVEENGATFTLLGEADAETTFALPGSDRVQPVEVQLDGRPAVVLLEGTTPTVRVGPGAHRIEGRLPWTTRPETLRVPDAIARVLLVEDGETSLANRGASGEVWLRATVAESLGEDRVTLEVHRELRDGSPMQLTTRIQVRAAGRARELSLGSVLPEGAVPVEIHADLPVRMDPSGPLTVQLRAGEFVIEIVARIADPETTYRRPSLEAPWPEQEVWVWVPDESYRQVELSGADGIDPSRTSLPPEWRSRSAFLVGRESALTLATSRRGEPTPPPSTLTLHRTLWLDASGAGYTARDELTVAMHGTHRIELLAPAEGTGAFDLGRITLAGQDQLITLASEGGRPGIELRATDATLTAEWRAEGILGEIPAVGWSEDAQSSSTTLNLPPGWELIHASDVDMAPGTWVDRWSLLGFFALLIISAAIGRVVGVRFGILAFFALGLSFHQDGAPKWIWLTLTVLLAIHRAITRRAGDKEAGGLAARALSASWLEQTLRIGYLVIGIFTIVGAVLFSAAQLKYALYPQLMPTSGGSYGDDASIAVSGLGLSRSAPEPAPAAAGWAGDDSGSMGALGDFAGAWNGPTSGYEADESDLRGGYGSNSIWLDPSAIVQTGFGLPSWSWSSYSLSFAGPVARDHTIHLVLSPPWLTRLFSLVRALLVLGLLGVMLMMRPRRPEKTEPDASATSKGGSGGASTGAAAGAAAAAIALIAIASIAAPARAQEIPSDAMLEALRQRLTAPPPCERCADANRITVRVEGDLLVAELEVSALIESAYPLPGPSATWAPTAVSIDGRPTSAVVRLDSGFLHVRVPEGVHVVRVEGPVGGRDALTLAFGRAPRHVVVEAEGWDVDGLSAETAAPESIQLRREIVEGPGETADMRSELPTWLEVERRIDIGVRWTISSVVRRLSPATSPAVARIPLLPGESVTDSTVTVENGQALVTLGQNATEVRWTSTLEPEPTLALTAPTEPRVSEVWVLACSALWHCETSGIAPTRSGSGVSWEPVFHPWPGETLSMSLTRPAAASGRSTTIDSASMVVQPGIRLTSVTLDLSVRTSVSAPVRITVPSDTEVRSLSVDGTTRPLQREGDDIVVALQPGSHDIALAWQTPHGWDLTFTTPDVRVDQAVVNASLNVEGSSDRWVLWLAGPAWGPAVLFWPYLAMVLVLAYALSWRKSVPLKVHDWVLLLLGLTQIPAFAALWVVGWFLVIEHRKSARIESVGWFALRQLAIAGYTAIAFGLLVWAVQAGLLGDPQMDVAGPGSWDQHWSFYVDRSEGPLPVATVVSAPIWVFRVLMFAWALWLALSMLKWARHGWDAYKTDGLLRPTGAGRDDEGGAPGAEGGAVSASEASVSEEASASTSDTSASASTSDTSASTSVSTTTTTSTTPSDPDPDNR